METVTLVRFTAPERQTFKNAGNWVDAKDKDPRDNGCVIFLLAREGSPCDKVRVKTALDELWRCKVRLHGNSVAGLPTGLVAPGTDLHALDEDLWDLAVREINPAINLLEAALRLME